MDLMDYRRKIIANSPHLKSASGAVATFSDGADLPLKSLLVDIEPVQSGSGDPSPSNIRPISGWSAVTIKNGNTISATISFGQTVYGGTLDVKSGVLTVDRAMVVFDGSESGWFLQGGKRCGISGALPNVKLVDGTTRVIGASSNAFTEQTPNKSYDGVVGFSIEPTGRLVVRQFSTNTMTLENWETWLASNPLQVVYPLANPVTIQLTPHQIRSLYGNNTIFADTGNVALEYWAHP